MGLRKNRKEVPKGGSNLTRKEGDFITPEKEGLDLEKGCSFQKETTFIGKRIELGRDLYVPKFFGGLNGVDLVSFLWGQGFGNLPRKKEKVHLKGGEGAY